MIDRWPDELAWIIRELKPTTLQRFVEFQPDAGPPKRRAKNTPIPGLTGSVELDEDAWDLLQTLVPEPGEPLGYTITDPQSGESKMATFWERPAVQQSTFVTGQPTKYIVQITLAVR
jgi:hypothetical protein